MLNKSKNEQVNMEKVKCACTDDGNTGQELTEAKQGKVILLLSRGYGKASETAWIYPANRLQVNINTG